MRKLIDIFMYIWTGLAYVGVFIILVLPAILAYCTQSWGWLLLYACYCFM